MQQQCCCWADLQPLVLGGAEDEGGRRAAAGVLLPVFLQVRGRLAGALAGAACKTNSLSETFRCQAPTLFCRFQNAFLQSCIHLSDLAAITTCRRSVLASLRSHVYSVSI